MALTTCILQASNYDGHQDDMPRINKLRKLTKKELDDCELPLSAIDTIISRYVHILMLSKGRAAHAK